MFSFTYKHSLIYKQSQVNQMSNSADLSHLSICNDTEDAPEKLARYFIKEKGFAESDLERDLFIDTCFNNETVHSKITITLSIQNKRVMIIRYAPGSLVTREKAALAAARILEKAYQIPLAVVTNGIALELLDTYSGNILSEGFASLPSKEELMSQMGTLQFKPYTDPKNIEKAKRILNVFDVNL